MRGSGRSKKRRVLRRKRISKKRRAPRRKRISTLRKRRSGAGTDYVLFGDSVNNDLELLKMRPELEAQDSGYLPYWPPSTRKKPKTPGPKKRAPFTTSQNKTYVFTEFI